MRVLGSVAIKENSLSRTPEAENSHIIIIHNNYVIAYVALFCNNVFLNDADNGNHLIMPIRYACKIILINFPFNGSSMLKMIKNDHLCR